MLPAIVAGAVFGLFLAFILGSKALGWFGKWLAVADSLEPAYAILVLGGFLPFRAMEAAAIYHQGWAREIWLTKYQESGEEKVLANLGIEVTPEYVFSYRVLKRLGVPTSDILIIERPCLDTEGEIREAALLTQAREKREPIILVTSKCHARRVKVLWKALAGPSYPAIVRYAGQDPFLPDRWFLNSRDAQAVTHEFFGLLNIFLGFPIRAHRS